MVYFAVISVFGWVRLRYDIARVFIVRIYRVNYPSGMGNQCLRRRGPSSDSSLVFYIPGADLPEVGIDTKLIRRLFS
jgi:hypothetical protein